MNDRCLFRGKRVDSGEWVVGYLYITNNGEYEISSYNAEIDIERMISIVIPETVGQCTGMKDNNGKPIFEGDILKLGTGKTRFVFYGVSGFRHTAYNGYAKEFDFKDKGYQVIGNIHDNPELLEVKE